MRRIARPQCWPQLAEMVLQIHGHLYAVQHLLFGDTCEQSCSMYALIANAATHTAVQLCCCCEAAMTSCTQCPVVCLAARCLKSAAAHSLTSDFEGELIPGKWYRALLWHHILQTALSCCSWHLPKHIVLEDSTLLVHFGHQAGESKLAAPDPASIRASCPHGHDVH